MAAATKMNLRHIEVFHAVYVNGSVSAAAKAVLQDQRGVTGLLLPTRPGDVTVSDENRAQRSMGSFGRELR